MLAYVIRRLSYGVVVVLGVLLFLFVLFFAVTTPDDVARQALGEKALPDVIERWAEVGVDRVVIGNIGVDGVRIFGDQVISRFQ